MAEIVTFAFALRYFIDAQGGTDTLSTQTGIVQKAADVTASIQGPNASVFSNLVLTAWRRVIAPPNPPGPRPAEANAAGATGRTLPVGQRPASQPSIPADNFGLQHTYEISGTSDGKAPLRVDALGYLEVSVSATVPLSPAPQGSNRFNAEVIVESTAWQQSAVGLILNYVKLVDQLVGYVPPSQSLFPITDWMFVQGGANPATLWWVAQSELYPPDPADYPIQFVLGSGSGEIDTGELLMTPRTISVTWNTPAEAANGINFRGGTVTAPGFAPIVNGGSYTLIEWLFNGSLSRQSNLLNYSVASAGP